ncbi:hypothetical protein [Microbulbifer magnicolonia]|uniref:hypothetical protein n=1 Tax=Microbulbifer magnicolonia TaxID=3109744 RepID=UPI002B4038C2|nr:hypothetical protein [Microbulbifer sp. GG15]
MIHRVFAWLSAILWIVVIGAGVYLFFGDFLNSYPVEVVYKEVCDENAELCSKRPDVINIAVQLGRLDFIGMALTVLGVGVGLSAVFSFLYIKEKSVIEAREAAKVAAESEMASLSDQAKEKIDAAIENLAAQAWEKVEEHLEAHKELMGLTGEVTGDIGDDIASSVEDSGNGN